MFPKKHIFLTCLLLLSCGFVLFFLLTSCTLQRGPGDYDFYLKHEGLRRHYKVHVPPTYDKKTPTPMLLAIHGGAGNAEGSVDYFQLNDKADSEGFIVVYPEGTGIKKLGILYGSWNGGTCCGSAHDNDVDDIGFFRALITKMKSDFRIDDNRIYATGMSNGAIMSYGLACEMSETIAAIAPVGSVGHFDSCTPTRPVPTMHFHGTHDPCAKYNGCEACESCVGQFLRDLGLDVELGTMKVTSVPDFIENWRTMNGCSDEAEITYHNKDATCITYQGCEADVTLCTIEGMGHTWPGRTTYAGKSCDSRPNGLLCTNYKNTVGPLNSDINANDAMWDFFNEHTLD